MSLESDLLADRRRLKRRLSLWRGLAIVVIAGLLALLAGFDRSAGRFGISGGPHIAWIDLVGVIQEDRWMQETLRDVADDHDAKALLVYISSPGGSTFGSEQLYVELRAVAARKPVVAVIGTMGASGGYLAALAADRIFARESSIAGSIGVLFQTVEVSRLMEKVGVSADQVTSGPLKGEPSPFKPLSTEARGAVQDLVNQSYDWFVGLVAARRNLPDARARELADGRIYQGREAVKLGLIDAIGGDREAIDWLVRERGIDAGLPQHRLRPGPPLPGWAEQSVAMARKVFLPERLTLDGLMSLWQPDPKS